MKLPDDIQELLKRRFQSKYREWLKAFASGNDSDTVWPLEINLGVPTEQKAIQQQESVRSWITTWKLWQGANQKFVDQKPAGSLVWAERRWQTLGTQSVPLKLTLASPDDVALWIGESARWLLAVDRFKTLVQRWPALFDALPRHYNVLADYSDSDFLRLADILSWICTNPNSNLYIRQIPVTGIDSKWLESRKSLVYELVSAIKDDQLEDRDFYGRCGIKPQPQLIRIRILDPVLRNRFGGLCDLSSPLEEIAGFDIKATHVFIVENLQSGLAFGDLTGSMVIMGLGYGVDVLGQIPWLRHARCMYWGDIDTHGFAILNRARTYLPNLEAVLMNESTLMNHRELWVEEKEQHASTDLLLLTDAEQKLYQSLKNNAWGQKIRLEQERIRWDEAWNALQGVIAFQSDPK